MATKAKGVTRRSKMPIADTIPRIADYNMKIADKMPRIADYNMKIADKMPRIADYNMKIADKMPRIAPKHPVGTAINPRFAEELYFQQKNLAITSRIARLSLLY
ncbi:hypothetical protein ACQKOF_22750 [Lysinibacillus sp. NPDC093190]|uniref:hypothetical protein n=1 Tax=Lysinibacillus sp. NPDC093190 TaxID=3390575 RepID=UPI003D078A5D